MNKNWGALFIFCTLWFCFTGCSNIQMSILVTSDPGNVPIEVNGVRIGNTPIRAILECDEAKKDKVVVIKAFPELEMGYFNQEKELNPCERLETLEGDIHFELDSKMSKNEDYPIQEY